MGLPPPGYLMVAPKKWGEHVPHQIIDSMKSTFRLGGELIQLRKLTKQDLNRRDIMAVV